MATMGLGMGMSPLLIQTFLAQNSQHMQMPWGMPPIQQQFKGAPGYWMHQNQKLAPVVEEEEVDDEEMGVAETYADYMPTKCKYAILVEHLNFK